MPGNAGRRRKETLTPMPAMAFMAARRSVAFGACRSIWRINWSSGVLMENDTQNNSGALLNGARIVTGRVFVLQGLSVDSIFLRALATEQLLHIPQRCLAHFTGALGLVLHQALSEAVQTVVCANGMRINRHGQRAVHA